MQPLWLTLGSAGFSVRCSAPAAAAPGASLPRATYAIVHADDELLVVDKGAGLLTVPGRGPDKADCLLARLRADGFDEVAHAPHRLDRDTSGLVALGRTAAAHRSLAVQFQERTVSKAYEALVLGAPREDDGRVDAPIAKERRPGELHARMRIAADGADGAKLSVTRWSVVERFERSGVRCARMRLLPVTGRAHQLRLHCAHLGLPILGDTLHGTGAAAAAAERLCLHASELAFEHPGRPGERVRFRSEARPF